MRKACVLVAAFDPGDTEAVVGGADHARDLDRDLDLADLGEGVIGAGIVVERDGALVGDEVISGEPVVADDDRVGWNRADVFDEPRQVPGDLRISGAIIDSSRSDGLRLAELVDLHHPGGDCTARSLPDEAAGKTGGEEQVGKGDQPPIARLDTGRADALVPYLRRFSERASRARGCGHSGWRRGGRASVVPLEVDPGGTSAMITGADSVRGGGNAMAHHLLAA